MLDNPAPYIDPSAGNKLRAFWNVQTPTLDSLKPKSLNMRILALLRDLGLMGLRLCLPGKAGLDGLVEGIHLDAESVGAFGM